ncbi:hypothetical protein Fmac_026577 [Flemingia macrophylla]|uniref:Uncharacterized protein n=1 Tax=Flemingia macrophylla TaxID=520843 RepID=A0ABD1LF85_9FABA
MKFSITNTIRGSGSHHSGLLPRAPESPSVGFGLQHQPQRHCWRLAVSSHTQILHLAALKLVLHDLQPCGPHSRISWQHGFTLGGGDSLHASPFALSGGGTSARQQ